MKEDSKKTSDEKIAGESQADEAVVSEEIDEVTPESYLALKKEILKKDVQIKDYVDSLQRLMAEFENFKKRMIKDHTNFVQMASEDLIVKLLPILDNFERAIVLTEEIEEHQGIIKGLEMVYSELIGVLEKEGLTAIPAKGQFNPELHEAVMQVEEEGYEENAIVDVLRKGYTLKDKLIRPAMVKVAKK